MTDAKAAPIVEREADYPIRFTASNGAVLEGVFRFRAIEDELAVSLRAANLAQGAPWASLDRMTQIQLAAVAALSVACVEAPEWFPLVPSKMLEWDVEFVAALEGEARKHTAGFFRRYAAASGVEAFKRGLAGGVVATVTGR